MKDATPTAQPGTPSHPHHLLPKGEQVVSGRGVTPVDEPEASGAATRRAGDDADAELMPCARVVSTLLGGPMTDGELDVPG